jgi:hypothetical protein
LPPLAEPLLAKRSYAITCIAPGKTSVSFGVKSPDGGPDSIAVNTFPATKSVTVR